MTKREFITEYMKNSNISSSYKTINGYRVNGREQIAIKCYCDYVSCNGWQMVENNQEKSS